MSGQGMPYIIFLIVTAVVSAASALYAWWRRPVPGNRTIVLTALAGAEWMVAYALELASTAVPTKIFWNQMQYVGVVIVPATWLVFTLQYTGREKRVTRRTLLLLSIEPIATLILAFTNEIHGLTHGLIWGAATLEPKGPFAMLIRPHGIGFWIHAAYTYTLLLAAATLLIQTLIHSHHLYRRQARLLLLATSLPMLGSLLMVSGLNPIPYLDLTPLSFTASILMLTWSLFRLRVGDIVPVARDVVLEGMSDGVIVLDEQSRIVDLNTVAQNMVGHAVSEVIGQPVEQIWPAWPGSVERFHGEAATSEEVVVDRENEQRVYDMRVSPIVDWRNHLISQVAVLRDITERKRMEQALRESEEKYRLHFENVTDVVYSIDPEFRVLSVSPSVERVLGYRPEELTGKPFQDLNVVAADDLEAAISNTKRVLAGEQIAPSVYEFIAKDGTSRIGEVSSAPLVRDGRVVAVVSVARDITERKQTEERLGIGTRVLESIAEGVNVSDENGVIVFTNPAFDAMLKYERGELIGKHISVLNYGPPEEGKRVTSEILEQLKTQGVWSGELCNVKKDGTPLTTYSRVSALEISDRQYWVTVQEDITERKRAEQALREHTERLGILHEIDSAILAAQSLEEIAQAALRHIQQLVPCQYASVSVFDFEAHQAIVIAAHATSDIGIEAGACVPLGGESIKTLRQSQVHLEKDIWGSPHPSPAAQTMQANGMRSCIIAPLTSQDELIGSLSLWSNQPSAFTPEQVQIARELADSLTIAIKHTRLFESVTQQREQLRALTVRLAEAEVTERRRLARELHDEVGKNLTVLGINLNLIRSQIPDETAVLAHSRLNDSLTLVEKIAASIRDVMTELRPPILDDYGLVATLHWYGEHFTSRTGVTVTVHGEEPDPRLASQTENTLFRIIQEALNNVAKHAQATQVMVTLTADDETVRLVVADDGVGFEPVKPTTPNGAQGWGLLTMSERAEAVGGSFRIESRKQGTQVIVEVAR